MADVHKAAQVGFTRVAGTYVSGRPDYPAALDRWLVELLGLGPGSVVVDLGAGTGKFTPLLARTGAQVIAVEPVDAMRGQLVAAMPGVRALAGRAEAIPLPAASADAVVCAQAFHWFANAAALAEIHRVVRPGGRLGLVWNVRDESVDWVAELTRIMTPYEGDAPRFYKGEWRQPFAEGWFTLPEPATFVHCHEGPAQAVVIDRVLSVSFIAALPDAERAKVRQRLETLIAEHLLLRGRERVSFPYRTEAYCCARLD